MACALDTLLAAFGGWIISTILATAMVPSAVTPEDIHLQTVLRWIGPIAGVIASLTTMKRRRLYLAGLKPFRFAQRGISRTFQNIRLFSDLTVLENVRIGMYLRRKTNLFDALFRTARLEREEAATIVLGAASARRVQSAARRERTGQKSAVWRPAPSGDRARARHRSAPAAAR